MKKTVLPYLEVKAVKGRTYVYFRKGKVRHRLPDDMDSQAFADAYWAIRSGRKTITTRNTWHQIVTRYYASAKFKRLAPGTRANYRRHCEAIREKNGDKPVAHFRRKHALAAQEALQDTWSKANERLAVLSILCKLAVDLEWIERNPVVDIPKLTGGEYEAWPDDKLAAFERYCDRHGLTTARTIYELCVGTGQRIGDAVKMEWADFDGEFMTVRQEKTGAPLQVYCPERLQSYLAGLPRNGRHILAKNLTQPLGKRAAQKAVEDVREALGVMRGEHRLVIHGWRYTAARQLAEAGCSDADIASVTGHRTLAMVQKYRKQADQKVRSRRAQEKRGK